MTQHRACSPYCSRLGSFSGQKLLVGLRFLLGVGLIGLVGFTFAADSPTKTDAPAKSDKLAKKAATVANAPKALAPWEILDAKGLSKRIDGHIQALLSQDKIAASGRSSDAEFCRRVYLDLTGRIPTAEQALAFIDDSDPAKREKLVDEVLKSKNYAFHMADIWQALLMPPNSDNRRLDGEPLVKWLEKSFEENKPWNVMTREILTASGEQDKNGATTYFLANSSIDRLTDSVCKLFMGVQLQCAQCHNHPFNPSWKQEDYWSTAAFFMKVKAQPPRGKDAAIPRVVENNAAPKQKMLPESVKHLPPKFPAGDKATFGPKEPYRPAFAKWLTSDANTFFAKAAVNRMWAQLFGRGLVHPIDDIQEGNPASHPGLLEDLAAQFRANKYDLHYLLKAICLSDAYQRTSKPAQGNENASAHYLARMPIKVLNPEQWYDSVTDLIAAGQLAADKAKAEDEKLRPNKENKENKENRENAKADKKNLKIPGRPGAPQRNQYIAFFKGDDGADQTEYQSGIPQVLRLMNSPQLNNQAIIRILDPKAKPQENTQKLYLAILGRKPTPKESARVNEMIAKVAAKPGEARQVYADLSWVLLNSSEFALNH